MKEIEIGEGFVALVDDDDYEVVSPHSWHKHVAKNTVYAQTSMHDGAKYRTVLMHRFVMSAQKGQILDHANHNGLDNRKSNLRFCSSTENCRNSLKHRRAGTSKYKGVRPSRSKWRARIKVDRKYIELGSFATENLAALAYNEKAMALFGEFASVNIIT